MTLNSRCSIKISRQSSGMRYQSRLSNKSEVENSRTQATSMGVRFIGSKILGKCDTTSDSLPALFSKAVVKNYSPVLVDYFLESITVIANCK